MADRKNSEDRARAGGRDDDILGIRHGGGRDQYGGTFGGGQSAGGAYANPHTGQGGGQGGGNRVTGERGDARHTGGQSNQGYYGSGQMGDRNYDDHDHNDASRASSPDAGDATYRDHPSQHGADVDDALARRVGAQGGDAHQGFGREHQGQRAQGREHGGPHTGPDSEPGSS